MKKQLAMLKDLIHWIVIAIVFFALYIFFHISLTNIHSGDATILEYIFIFGILLLTLISIIKEYSPDAEITLQPSGFKGGIWDDYGNLVIAKLKK